MGGGPVFLCDFVSIDVAKARSGSGAWGVGRRWWPPLVFKFGELFIFRMDLSSLADSDCTPAPLVLQ